ncbi:DUF7710 domain-containing protein [Arenimonas oryziterrae]|uniref:DUF7710 domain-containing protein n=1 Tax=Arenimonas oryziterrae TaxID=498055 RepID=UPI0009DC2683
METVWIFNGDQASLPAAVFSSRAKAEDWINSNRLSGILTEYPLDTSALDWAIQNGYFTPKGDRHKQSRFIQSFTSGSQAHFHYSFDDI